VGPSIEALVQLLDLFVPITRCVNCGNNLLAYVRYGRAFELALSVVKRSLNGNLDEQRMPVRLVCCRLSCRVHVSNH
jgi:hypothetical protein